MDYLVSTITDRYGDETIINICLPDVIKIAQVTKLDKFNNYIGLVYTKENTEILEKLSKIKNVELVTMPGNLTLILIYHIKFLNESPKLTDLFDISNIIRLENCNVVYLKVSADSGKIESAYKFVEFISMTQVRICDVTLLDSDTETYLRYPSLSYTIADLSRALSIESDDAPYYIKMIVDKEEGFRCWNSIGKLVKSAAEFFNLNEPDFDFNKFIPIVKVMNDRNASLSNN